MLYLCRNDLDDLTFGTFTCSCYILSTTVQHVLAENINLSVCFSGVFPVFSTGIKAKSIVFGKNKKQYGRSPGLLQAISQKEIYVSKSFKLVEN